MSKYVKLAVACVIVLMAMLALAASPALSGLDVVGKNSVTMFGEILENVPTEEADGNWSLAAPDGTSRFVWNGDSGALEVDAAPFVKAGLDPEKLPAAGYAFSGGTLTVGTLSPASSASTASTGIDAYARLVASRREVINYHSFLDHYGVKVGGGNMFEWAKDLATNAYDDSVQDKDIVFALNPKPLADAGLDPKSVEGWLHAEAPVETDAGIVLEWNLLKPFNLK